MLVSFSVRNFGPYADGATLMMVPGSGRLKGDHVFDGLLRHAVVYGANASGKSSLTDAISMLKGLCTDPLFHLDSPKVNWDSDDPVIRFNVCFTSRGDTYDYSLEVEPSGDGGAPVTFRTVKESLRVSNAAGDGRLVFKRGPSQERDGGKLGRLLSVDSDIRASLDAIMSQRDMASLEGAELDVESGSPTVVSPMADGHVLKDIDTRIGQHLGVFADDPFVVGDIVTQIGFTPVVESVFRAESGIDHVGVQQFLDIVWAVYVGCGWRTQFTPVGRLIVTVTTHPDKIENADGLVSAFCF